MLFLFTIWSAISKAVLAEGGVVVVGLNILVPLILLEHIFAAPYLYIWYNCWLMMPAPAVLFLSNVHLLPLLGTFWKDVATLVTPKLLTRICLFSLSLSPPIHHSFSSVYIVVYSTENCFRSVSQDSGIVEFPIVFNREVNSMNYFIYYLF